MAALPVRTASDEAYSSGTHTTYGAEQHLTNASKVAEGLHGMFLQARLLVAYPVQDLGKLLQNVAASPGCELSHAGVAAVHKVLQQREGLALQMSRQSCQCMMYYIGVKHTSRTRTWDEAMYRGLRDAFQKHSQPHERPNKCKLVPQNTTYQALVRAAELFTPILPGIFPPSGGARTGDFAPCANLITKDVSMGSALVANGR